jgi:replicative DNA helicase
MTSPVDQSTLSLPSSIDAEQAVIGAVLLNPDALIHCHGLEAQHFYEPAHSAIWQRIIDYSERGDRVAYTVLAASFRDGPIFVGGPSAKEYLAKLASEATTISGIGVHASLIRSTWALRQIVSVGGGVQQSWGGLIPEDMVRNSFEHLDEIRASLVQTSATRPRSISAIGRDVITRAADVLSGNGTQPPSTGLPDLDAKLPMRGLAPGSLFVVAGRTGMGKSMALASIARQAVKTTGVAFFSLEVGAEEMAARMIADAMGNGPTYEQILTGSISEQDLQRADEAFDRHIKGAPISIDASAGLTMGDIERRCSVLAGDLAREDKTLGLVVIDHAQIVKPSSRYQGNRVGELGEIANAAKVLAKRLNCCVALASQVNRSVEQKDDKRPTMADLRASGEIEEAADCIGLLYRPAYYVERSPEFKAGDPIKRDEFEAVKNVLELAIDKSRQGRTGVVNLWCDPSRSMVRCLTPVERHFGGRR